KSNDVKVLEIRDYIRNPKPSGYTSYHMIVSTPINMGDRKVDTVVEIQIRTVAMDFWASLEHKIQYKFEGEGNTPVYISNDLRDCARIVADLDARMLALNQAIQEIEA
ncbi:MAG: GTP pyrophosphokinase family protein, partial [Lachnospiraceae bacterium]|nr:GTP pyrophosphokinase family protein [Lachnospiraceae bacterium]